MSFPINTNVPLGSNKPRNDVTPMRTNFNNIDGFLSVDHVAPGTEGDGFHQQVTFWEENPPPAPGQPDSPEGDTSVLYTDVGIADPTLPELFFQNEDFRSPISALRVMFRFTYARANPPGQPLPSATLSPTQYNVNGGVTIGGGNTTFTVMWSNNALADGQNAIAHVSVSFPLVSTNINRSFTISPTNILIAFASEPPTGTIVHVTIWEI